MNIKLKTYFALELQCSFPLIMALDFAYANGDMMIVWRRFAATLGISVGRMASGECAKYHWGNGILYILFGDHSFGVQHGWYLNWVFRFEDANLIEKINTVCRELKDVKNTELDDAVRRALKHIKSTDLEIK